MYTMRALDLSISLINSVAQVHDTLRHLAPDFNLRKCLPFDRLRLSASADPSSTYHQVGGAHQPQLLANFLHPPNLSPRPPILSIAPTSSTASSPPRSPCSVHVSSFPVRSARPGTALASFSVAFLPTLQRVFHISLPMSLRDILLSEPGPDIPVDDPCSRCNPPQKSR